MKPLGEVICQFGMMMIPLYIWMLDCLRETVGGLTQCLETGQIWMELNNFRSILISLNSHSYLVPRLGHHWSWMGQLGVPPGLTAVAWVVGSSCRRTFASISYAFQVCPFLNWEGPLDGFSCNDRIMIGLLQCSWRPSRTCSWFKIQQCKQ